MKDVIDSVPVLAKHGGDRKSQSRLDQGDAITLIRGSTGSDYLAARIKRDAPNVAERISDFPSMAAAAKAAGIPAAAPRVNLGAPAGVAKKLVQRGPDYARAVEILDRQAFATGIPDAGM